MSRLVCLAPSPTLESLPQAVVDRFPRTALLDIHPGLLQLWVAAGQIELAEERFDAVRVAAGLLERAPA